ncbi:hypothetical protein P154DRAFT_532261 [Amniculicola lignicola CBS 123094]|uniref:Uncharacterized protein n=1 Tax=Amniculicola lignicola CBS 123094 TaxID=1392246 RepID=A0A6A5X0R5_9PLEO|nr:hypothetical protein P154DRAFT_532261 [Amniculicola lignicola CBS 123094]
MHYCNILLERTNIIADYTTSIGIVGSIIPNIRLVRSPVRIFHSNDPGVYPRIHSKKACTTLRPPPNDPRLLEATSAKMRILITSASRPAALAIARTLKSPEHEIYGADTERVRWTSPARWSNAYTAFIPVTSWRLLFLRFASQVDMIVPCGDESHFLPSLSAGITVVYHPLFRSGYAYEEFLQKKVILGTSTVQLKPYDRCLDLEDYDAHTLVTGGQIKTFLVTKPGAAGPADEEEYDLVPDNGALSMALFQFMTEFLEKYKKEPSVRINPTFDSLYGEWSNINMFLSMRFQIREEVRNNRLVRNIYVGYYSTTPHCSMVLFAQNTNSQEWMRNAFMWPATNHIPLTTEDINANLRGTYSLPTLLRAWYNRSFRHATFWRITWWIGILEMALMTLVALLYFKEELFASSDVGPALASWLLTWWADWICVIWDEETYFWVPKAKMMAMYLISLCHGGIREPHSPKLS